jgi:dTDP-4-dehydrorhamnose 3,5-epimerase
MDHFKVEDERFGGRVKLISSTCFEDERGFFNITYLNDEMREMGLPPFVRDLHSRSMKDVVRGLHFQSTPPMAKLMRVPRGRVFMVTVDVNPQSPTFLQHYSLIMEEGDKLQLWGEADIARGFCALEDYSEVQYKCSGHFNKAFDDAILWNDPIIGIDWPVKDHPILSDRDKHALTAKEFFHLCTP